MLEELHVAGLGVIQDAWLEFGPGLNVLTGETGTGKTLITVALSLALGARSTSGLVRSGSPALWVEARFSSVSGGEAAEFADDGEIVLARTVGADGKSSARAGGRLAPVGSVAALGAELVEILGQHQAERLLSPRAQTDFLDRFAGPEHGAVLGRYRSVHAELRAARSRLERLGRDARQRERDRDVLAYQVREIETAMVTPGEMSALAEEQSRLAHGERILELLGDVEGALGGDGAASDALRTAGAAVQGASALDPRLAEASGRLSSVVAETEDILADIRSYRDALDRDPKRLAWVGERIQALKGLERKYGDGERGIVAFLADARSRLRSREDEDAEVTTLAEQTDALARQSAELAAMLSQGRASRAEELAEALTEEVRQLGMPGARVVVDLAPLDQPGPDGVEQVMLKLAGGPGQPLAPLARVASGGELSRTMLACRSVLADLDDVDTLVFDEVDNGIGGRTAGAVARRLAGLADSRQVLVVTHLAQIAAAAGRHFLVTKDGGTATVTRLEGEDRVAEIARMLAGSGGEVAMAHARELLAPEAGRGRPAGRMRRRPGPVTASAS